MSVFYQCELTLNSRDDELDDGFTEAVVERSKPALKPPSKYKVIILNDDFTPMEFVVEVLQGVFAMNREVATQVMLKVHSEGKAVCGVYTRDIAETKAATVNDLARSENHPLLSDIERADD